MADLAAHLQEVVGEGLGSVEAEQWARLSPLIVSKGLEAALLEAPPTAGLEVVIAARTGDFIASRERDIVAEVFRNNRTLRFTRLLRHLVKPEGGLPVVTTNYDRLIEVAAEEAGLGVDTMFVGQFAGSLNETESRLSFVRDVSLLPNRHVRWRHRERVNIYKPHGSLDWYYREGNPVRYAGDLPVPRLLITPGLNKFRNGYESPFDRHRERANSAIDRASRFLVIGYGFNDDHLETHLTPRIRSGIPTLLMTRTLSPNARKLATEHTNVLAIERDGDRTDSGSLVFVDKREIAFPSLALWELDSFISEVLGP